MNKLGLVVLLLSFCFFQSSYLLAQKNKNTATATVRTKVNTALAANKANNSDGLLISGPMLGYAEHREVLIWLEVSRAVSNISIEYWPSETPQNISTFSYVGSLQQLFNPVKLLIPALDMGTTYGYRILLNGQEQSFDYPLQFSTKVLWEWRTDAPDFSFLFGSCMYINDSIYDRPGKPYGQDLNVIEAMINTPSEFIIWGGDNVYLREADWTSNYGIWYRYQHVRQQAPLQALLASRPNYAIWDDHDFGPNDSNKSYPLKQAALHAFTNYWGNQSYGEEDNPGIYGQFRYSDCDFFLLDNRYYRANEDLKANNPDKTFLGKKQMEWLKNALLSSPASFKFVICGSQMLNTINRFECFNHYQKEYNELMGFIQEHQIEGIVFLSGDRHFSEILRITPKGFYPLHEITSSPISSRAYKKVTEGKESKNPNRVAGTLTNQLNYMQLGISGKRKQRVLTITCLDEFGNTLWEQQIKQEDLRLTPKSAIDKK